MLSKEEIKNIICQQTWVEVDSSRVYGIDEAAECLLKAIDAAQHSVQRICANCGASIWANAIVVGGKEYCTKCGAIR